MTRSQTLARTLSTALAISAIAVPVAGARPIEVGPFHNHSVAPATVNAPGTDVGAPDQQAPAITKISPQEDLRSPDARGAGERASAITPAQDLRSPDARDAGPRPHGTQPVLLVPALADGRDGTPWSTIGLALVGCLALAGTAATAGRIRRRTGRAGITA
jgi:hypothetical protein